jgi:cysteine-rich repeat protein
MLPEPALSWTAVGRVGIQLASLPLRGAATAIACATACMINPDWDGPIDDGTSGGDTSIDATTFDVDETTAMDGATSAGESDGTGVVPGCGNSIVEGIETCDDGNDMNGDGCNNDCNESGMLAWQLLWDGGRDGWDRVHDLGLLPDGSVVTAGVTHTDLGIQAEQVRISAAGVEVARHRHTGEGAIDTQSWGACAFQGGSLLAGNGDNQMIFVHALDADGVLVDEYVGPGRVHDATSDGTEVWIAGQVADETAAVFHLSADLELVATYDEASGSMPLGSVVWGITEQDAHVIVAGEVYSPNRGFVRELWKSDGSVEWDYDVVELGGDSDSAYGATAIAGGAIAMVGDVQFGLERNGWLMRRDTGGRLLDDIEQEDLGNYHGVAIGPEGEIAVAGWVDNGLGKLALLVKYAVDGSLAWRREITGELVVAENLAWTVVIREDGVIVIGGQLVQETTGLDAWVAAYTP